MWAMHSIRETCGVIDIYHYLKLFEVINEYKNIILLIFNLVIKFK